MGSLAGPRNAFCVTMTSSDTLQLWPSFAVMTYNIPAFCSVIHDGFLFPHILQNNLVKFAVYSLSLKQLAARSAECRNVRFAWSVLKL